MKQNLFNKLWLRVGMIVAIMTTALSGTAWADTQEIALNNLYQKGTKVTAKTVCSTSGSSLTFTDEDGAFSIKITKNSGNQPGFYTSSGYIRFYEDDVVEVESLSGAVMSSIVITTNNQLDASVPVTVSPGALSETTWSGSASKVTFTGTGTNKWNKLTITYSSSGTPTPTTYTVTYNANGGNGTMTDSNSPYSAGATVTVMENTFTRTGYDFTGWNTAADGSGTDYDEGATFTISANTTLYAQWEEQASGDAQWVLTSLADLTASDVFVIVGNGYAMTNNNGTDSAPATSAVTITGSAITSTVAANIQWTVSGDATNGYTFYPKGSTTTWLYCNTTAASGSNNNIRVGTGDRKVFELNSNNYLITKDANTTRYLSIYNNADWRGYTNTNNGVVALSFYKKVTGGVVPPTIAAEDVNLAYNANSGEITYTITNPVEGTTLAATTEADWISNVIVDATNKKVTFTVTANTGSVRNATITLTYGEVTKNVTITQAAAPVTSDWVATSLADLTADDVFVIVGNNGSKYAMSNNNGTGSAPAAVAVKVSGNYITSQVPETIRWTISGNATDGYTFYPNGDTEKWLYCTNTNNGVRVGTNDNKTFTVDEGYLKNGGTSRYVGIYNSSDWRCYTSINSNIGNQTFTFYKYVGAPLPAITAEDVEIAYNVTSGSISYEVENPVTGGTLTASTEDTWLDLGDVSAAAVPFTASANDNPIARTASVTLTYTYGTETATKTITVTQTGNPDAKGGANNPYTVTEALAVISSLEDGGKTESEVYTKGTITAIEEVELEQYYNATYTISDETNDLMVYHGKYIDNANFTSADQIHEGDAVVIYGKLQKFVKQSTTTPEIAQGNYIVSQTTSITLNASGYATFASTSAVDFSNAETNGYSAWAVTAVSGSEITFSQITGAVAAGTGVLLKGTANDQVTIEYTTSGATLSDNKLVGFTAATEINSNEYFGLSGAKFVKVNTGTVPAGKALLPASVVEGTSPVNAFTFNFDEDATAIKAIDNGQLTTDGVIYNVAGQRLSKMQKGINIVNGKKILK